MFATSFSKLRSRRNKSLDRVFAVKALLLVAAIMLAGEGVRWVGMYYRIAIDLQYDPCLPARLLLVQMKVTGEIQRGDLVAYRTDRAGQYIDPDTLMGKRVAGVEGDRYAIRNQMLYLNGVVTRELALCRTKHLSHYCDDRSGVVPSGHVFLLADHPNSYDSRYWGPIPTDHLVGRIIWPDLPELVAAS